jgi:ribosomal-protein-alanine N-acetyltransferase
LRRWRSTDVGTLQRYANNRKIWLNLRDRFPSPYTRSDAESWISLCEAEKELVLQFAIDSGGEAIGGIGFERLQDVHRLSAEIGYWIAEPFWGKGVATAAVGLATTYAFDVLEMERVRAMVFEWNPASARVIEKNGYAFEGRMRRSIIKDGRLLDSLLYSRIRQGGFKRFSPARYRSTRLPPGSNSSVSRHSQG